jgi:putative spermidine/putrescine transport system substrate-binding protein
MHHHESPLLVFRFIVLAFLTQASFPVEARETLRILAWEGYADTEIVSVFELRFDVDVAVTYANSDDDL